MQRIYLDHNATTPPSAAVVEGLTAALRDAYGNPSSIHHFGQKAKALVDDARSQVAALIGAEPSEVLFTSGGTEAINLAVKGSAWAGKGTGNRIVTTGVEHEAVVFRQPEVPHRLQSAAVRVGRAGVGACVQKAAGGVPKKDYQ